MGGARMIKPSSLSAGIVKTSINSQIEVSMKTTALLPIIVLLSACAPTDMRPALERGMASIPASQYANAQTVEEIRKLRPQAQIPLKIAIKVSNNSYNYRRHGLSAAEKAVLDHLGEKLKQLGFASRFELIPDSINPFMSSSCDHKNDGGCFEPGLREAGARLGADAILILGDSTVTDSYVNPLSLLDLSIVGFWIVPSHHRDSYSAYEATLFDIDNGYEIYSNFELVQNKLCSVSFLVSQTTYPVLFLSKFDGRL